MVFLLLIAVLSLQLVSISESANARQIGATYTINLNSTYQDDYWPCPGDEIHFICEITGSSSLILSWSSITYIGRNNELSFHYHDDKGFNQTGIDRTIAFLVNKRKFNSNGERVHVLVSNLSIWVNTSNSVQSVTCAGDSENMRRTIRFQALGTPPAPKHVDSKLIRDIAGHCALQVAIVRKNNPTIEDVPHFAMYINDHKSGDINRTDPLILISHQICTCDQDNVINISAVNRCGEEGQNLSKVVDDVITLHDLPNCHQSTTTSDITTTMATTTPPTTDHETTNEHTTTGGSKDTSSNVALSASLALFVLILTVKLY